MCSVFPVLKHAFPKVLPSWLRDSPVPALSSTRQSLAFISPFYAYIYLHTHLLTVVVVKIVSIRGVIFLSYQVLPFSIKKIVIFM